MINYADILIAGKINKQSGIFLIKKTISTPISLSSPKLFI